METEKALSSIKRSRTYKNSPDNQDYIAQIEKDFERLKTDKAFQEIDQVKMIRQKMKSIIVAANLKLIQEDDAEKRLKIKADIASYKWLMQFFTRNVEREMAEINAKLNEHLSEI